RMQVSVTPASPLTGPTDGGFGTDGTTDDNNPTVSETPEPETEELEEPETETVTAVDTPVTTAPVIPESSINVPIAPAPSPNLTNPQANLPVEEPAPEPNLDPVTPTAPQTAAPIENEAPIQRQAFDFSGLNRTAFTRELDRTGEDIRQHEPLLETSVAKVAFAFGSALSVGGVSWLLRGGALAAALMSSMPAWRRFDPIAVVTGREDEGEDREPTDLERMLAHVQDAGNRTNDPMTEPTERTVR
ncbi:MAG: hypothetical protein AAFU56_03470, partial [Pseudomonadota bacterium]